MDWQSCDRCKHESKEAGEHPCYECGLEGKNYEPKTNADRIRNMTDEELAKYISNDFDNICDEKYCSGTCGDNCIECVLEWLQAEVKEGENHA